MNAPSVSCPRCGQSAEVSTPLEGRKLRCRRCSQVLRVATAADSTSDLVLARKSADLRMTIGALSCVVGALWLVYAGMLSSDAPIGLVLVEALVAVVFGARLLVHASERVDAIDGIVQDTRAHVRRVRRRAARSALRARGSLA